MAQAHAPVRSENGRLVEPRTESSDLAGALARTLEAKIEQGFQVESRTETTAVLVMKGRSRWFGLANAPSARYEITLDEGGRVKSRRL